MTVVSPSIRHGQLVASARQSLRLSQTSLADLAGCSQQTVSRIEKGEQATSDRLKVRLAAALGAKVGDLFSLDEEE